MGTKVAYKCGKTQEAYRHLFEELPSLEVRVFEHVFHTVDRPGWHSHLCVRVYVCAFVEVNRLYFVRLCPSHCRRAQPAPSPVYNSGCVTVVLQCCYSGVTVLLQWCYSVVTVLLQ
jgi:hypothetical protein